MLNLQERSQFLAQRNADPELIVKLQQLERESTDRLFVVLAEFGDERHPDYPDQDTDPDWPGPATFDGPVHNAIPEPDRAVDNSTNWQADYDQAHYQGLYFGTDRESVKTYYETQSSGRYSVDGTVTDWVKVPFNEARYGRSDGFPCATNVCSNTWALVRDGMQAWYDSQRAAGQSPAQIATTLAKYDVWDRNDADGCRLERSTVTRGRRGRRFLVDSGGLQ